VSDYERALGNRSGCDKIPYSGLRDDCKDQRRAKQHCKNGKYKGNPIKKGCKSYQPDKNAGDGNYGDLMEGMKDQLGKCVEARADEQAAFDKAVRKVKSERADGVTDALKRRMIDHLESGKRGHEQAIDDTQRMVDKCERKIDTWKDLHRRWKAKNR